MKPELHVRFSDLVDYPTTSVDGFGDVTTIRPVGAGFAFLKEAYEHGYGIVVVMRERRVTSTLYNSIRAMLVTNVLTDGFMKAYGGNRLTAHKVVDDITIVERQYDLTKPWAQPDDSNNWAIITKTRENTQ
jgi:hypothetical protein